MSEAGFKARTAQQVGNMRRRLDAKTRGGLSVPFTLEEYRAWLVGELGGRWDGLKRCPYCNAPINFSTGVPDHRTALASGGAPGLDNLDFICEPCNDRKGRLSAGAYRAVLVLADTLAPADRQDLLQRLAIAVQLASAKNWARRRERNRAEIAAYARDLG